MSEIPLQDVAKVADSFEADLSTAPPGESAAISWQSASRTDLGRVRHINEDAFLDSEDQRLWVVADGMGGQSRGDYASGAVIRHLREFPHQHSVLANLKDLEERLQAANEQCRTAFRNKRPGTTVVALLTHGSHCFYLWAGDSRMYRLREGELEQLTLDHSVAQEKYARGELTEEESKNHDSAHVLTRAVGIREKLQLDLGYAQVNPGDRYLLCSDGLYNPVELQNIHSLLAQGNPEQACESLVDRALECGARDNVTVIVVEASAPS